MDNGNKDRSASSIFFERFSISPRSNQELEWWAQQILDWADRDDSLVMMSFCAEMGIVERRLYDWAKRCDRLDGAMKIARSKVGARRERLALENKANSSIVLKTMSLYNPEYHEYEKEMKLLGNEADMKSQTINVVMPQMPSVVSVPKKRGRPRKDAV